MSQAMPTETALPLCPHTLPFGPPHWAEPAHHSYRDAAHELTLIYHGVTEREMAAVQWGEASFALVVEPPLIVLCYRFGNGIPWSVAPCRWQRVPSSDRLLGPVPSAFPEVEGHVKVTLVEASDNRILVRRLAPLAPALTRAWNAAMRRQALQHCSEARYSAALAQFARRFPRADALLGLALATSIDGE
jgi:hypothetical protein